MNNTKEKIIDEFIEELNEYGKRKGFVFGTNASLKVADAYVMTLLLERDISPLDYIEQNIDDILDMYHEDIVILKGE